jgi:hypothetical protein
VRKAAYIASIAEIAKIAKGEPGYARRIFTFPGGEVHVLIANNSKLADVMDEAAAASYNVADAIPPSQLN